MTSTKLLSRYRFVPVIAGVCALWLGLPSSIAGAQDAEITPRSFFGLWVDAEQYTCRSFDNAEGEWFELTDGELIEGAGFACDVKLTLNGRTLVAEAKQCQGEEGEVSDGLRRAYTLLNAKTLESKGLTFIRCKDAAALAAENWTANVYPKQEQVVVEAKAMDGKVKLVGGCNRKTDRGFNFSIYGYEGEKLERVDDARRAVGLDVLIGTQVERILAEMHYFAPDRAWVLSNPLDTAALETLDRGEVLHIRNSLDQVALSFDLGSFKNARETMQNVCGL